MREPFSRLLDSGERLRAAGEVELAQTTGPLAMPAELLALFSPLISLVLFVRLDGALPRTLGVLLPPLCAILLARFVVRRWRRPREWIGVTDQRILRWRRPAALLGGPRIEAVSLDGIVGVESEQDDWDRRRLTHQLVIHRKFAAQPLGRLRNAEQVRDAIINVARARAEPAPGAPPSAANRIVAPPAVLPQDFRPS